MTDAGEPAPDSVEPPGVAPVDSSDWVKPVELIELLHRRSAKRKQVKAPTSSPFYDADFVERHRSRSDPKSD